MHPFTTQDSVSVAVPPSELIDVQPQKLLPELGAHQNPGLQRAVYLSNEIWAVGPMSNASPQTPYPSAENNQSQKIKVQGEVKIRYTPRINKRLSAQLPLFYWLGIGAWVRDMVIYHWFKNFICHMKAGAAAYTAVRHVIQSCLLDGKWPTWQWWLFLFLDKLTLQAGELD